MAPRPLILGITTLLAAAMAVGPSAADTPGTTLNDVDRLWPAGSKTTEIVPESETPGKREDGSGAFRTHCVESHSSNDDPLMAPNKPGAAHHHIFFGNPDVDAYTTPDSLLEASATTCDGVALNKSGYWVPALYGESGERLEYVDPLFYYKTGYHLPARIHHTAASGPADDRRRCNLTQRAGRRGREIPLRELAGTRSPVQPG